MPENIGAIYQYEPLPDDRLLVMRHALEMRGVTLDYRVESTAIDGAHAIITLLEPNIGQGSDIKKLAAEDDSYRDGFLGIEGAEIRTENYPKIIARLAQSEGEKKTITGDADSVNAWYEGDRCTIITIPLASLELESVRAQHNQEAMAWFRGLLKEYPDAWLEPHRPGIAMSEDGTRGQILIPIGTLEMARLWRGEILNMAFNAKGETTCELPWNESHVVCRKVPNRNPAMDVRGDMLIGQMETWPYLIAMDMQAADLRARAMLERYAGPAQEHNRRAAKDNERNAYLTEQMHELLGPDFPKGGDEVEAAVIHGHICIVPARGNKEYAERLRSEWTRGRGSSQGVLLSSDKRNPTLYLKPEKMDEDTRQAIQDWAARKKEQVAARKPERSRTPQSLSSAREDAETTKRPSR